MQAAAAILGCPARVTPRFVTRSVHTNSLSLSRSLALALSLLLSPPPFLSHSLTHSPPPCARTVPPFPSPFTTTRTERAQKQPAVLEDDARQKAAGRRRQENRTRAARLRATRLRARRRPGTAQTRGVVARCPRERRPARGGGEGWGCGRREERGAAMGCGGGGPQRRAPADRADSVTLVLVSVGRDWSARSRSFFVHTAPGSLCPGRHSQAVKPLWFGRTLAQHLVRLHSAEAARGATERGGAAQRGKGGDRIVAAMSRPPPAAVASALAERPGRATRGPHLLKMPWPRGPHSQKMAWPRGLGCCSLLQLLRRDRAPALKGRD